MKKYRSFLLIAIMLFVLCVFNSCSGPGKKDKGDRPPPLPQEKFVSTIYGTKSFNVDINQLPPMYTGHNPELLYNNIRLRQEMVKRHPEETAEQHRIRIAGEIYTPLMGSLDFDSVYAFRISPGNETYNAGKKVIQLSFNLAPMFEKGLESTKRAFVVRYQPQLDNSSVIIEKNGSRRVIEEKKFTEYAIVPVDDAGIPIENRDTITATAAMTPEEARKSEGDIMFLLIGKLVSPYVSYEEINRNPLPGTSGTYLGRYHYLHIRIIDMWIYDVTSGRILKKGMRS